MRSSEKGCPFRNCIYTFLIKTGNAKSGFKLSPFSLHLQLGADTSGNGECSGTGARTILLGTHIQVRRGRNFGGVGQLVTGDVVGECMILADIAPGGIAIHTQAEDVCVGHRVGYAGVLILSIQRYIPVLLVVALVHVFRGLV